MERRLAAVLIADVAGYGRLSQADEEGTRARFQATLHEVFEPKITAHHGRLVKTMGDGLLVEFHSVVNALRCAIEIQTIEAARNADIPVNRRLKFRIGINLGDVIVEGDDIQGDGVNIAHRLQGLADEGGIALSAAAHEQVKNKLDIGFEFLGEQRLKNIADPVRVYRVMIDSTVVGETIRGRRFVGRFRRPSAVVGAAIVLLIAGGVAWWGPWQSMIEPASTERMALPLPDKPSIAVLPFVNMSDDPKQKYFADGITDDLITDLSQVSSLFVISRNSTFTYKEKAVDPKQVAKELGVRYVLEGSVQRAGEQVRINSQLIDTVSGGHIWAERYDGSLSDVFSLQDKVTRSITNALALRLTDEDQQVLGRQETAIPAAYDAFLRGWEQFLRATPEGYREAIPYFEQAIKLDPDYGRAYAALALDYYWSVTKSWHRGVQEITPEVAEVINRNLREAEKHPTSTSHQVAGLIAFGWGTFPAAISEFNAAIALDPSDSWSYAYMARALAFAGRPSEALQYIKTAMRVDPHYPPIFLAFQGLAQFGLEQYEESAASLEQATRLNPDDAAGLLLLAAANGYLGRKQEAMSAIAAYDALGRRSGAAPVTATFAWGTWSLYHRREQDRLYNGLVRAGVPEEAPVKSQ